MATETEPNDSPETAQRIEMTETVAGQLDPVQPATRPDEDWYLIQPAHPPQDVRIQLVDIPGRDAPAGGKFVLEVYDRDHDRIESKTGSLAHDPLTPELASLSALRVRDALYVRISGQPFRYKLHVELEAPDPDSEAEPNNRAVDATPLPLDHPLRGTYGSETDQDYYVLDLAPDAGTLAAPAASDAGAAALDAGATAPAEPTEMLRIEVAAIPGVRHSLTLFDDAQVPLARFSSREPGGPLVVRDFALRPGMRRITLLLEAAHARKKAAAESPSGQPYTLTVHREAAPPNLELEPNDTLDLATPLDATRVGYLFPSGDVDTYRLHLDGPSRIHAMLSALDRVDTELSVVEPPAAGGPASGTTILKVNEGGTKEPEVIPSIALGAGDHFLRVQAAAHQVGSKWVRDQEDPAQAYHLDVERMPDDGSFEREPNDTPDQATPIAPGQTLSGYAFPSRDIDIYRLDLSTQPVPTGVGFRLSGVSKVPLLLELREGGEGKLGELLNSADSGKPGVETQLQQKLDPGVYFLVVKPHPASRAPGLPQSDSETPYKLTVQLQ